MPRAFAATLLVLALTAQAASGEPSAAEAPATGAAPAPPPPQLTKAPVLRHFVEAAYPAEAQAHGLEGAVLLDIDIGVDGRVANPRVAQPAGHGFDEAALAAVAQFEFEPAEFDQKPAPVRVTYKYEFLFRPPPPPDKPPEAAKPHVVTYEGTLLERGTRVPMAGAVVEAEQGGVEREAACDAAGHFAFEDLAPGSWKVAVHQPKYDPFQTSEEVRAGEVTTATYYIRRRAGQYEVTVRGRREQKEVARRTLTLEEIQKIPGTQGDAIRVVQNLPGVARTPLGLGPLIVRGGRAGDTRTYIDGQLIPLLFHFGGLTGVINSEFLESLDFYPGNYPVRFGRSTAGAVDVNTRAGRRERYRGYANVNLTESTLFLEGPLLTHGAFMASVRRSYIDVVLPVILRLVTNSDAVNFSVAPRYWDYQLKVDFDWGRDRLSVFSFGSDDELSFLLKNPSQFTTENRGNFFSNIGFHRVSAKWDHKLATGLTNRLSATVGADQTKTGAGPDIYIKATINLLTVREDLSWKAADWLTVDGGVDLLATTFTYGVQAPPLPAPGQTFNPNLNNQLQLSTDSGSSVEPAAYLDAVLRPFEGLKLVPGIRGDWNQYLRRAWVDPRLTAFYDLGEHLTLKASAGLYHQPPTPEKLTKKFGNPDLTEEGTAQYAAGVELRFLELWDLDLQAYWKDLFGEATNAISLTTTAQQQAFARTPFQNTGKGYAYGTELLLRRAPGRSVFGWLAVSLGQAYRQAAPGEPFIQSMLNQRFNVVGVVSWKGPWDMDFGARVRFTDGNPWTNYATHLYDVDSDNTLPIPALQKRTERRPPFFQLDVRLDKTWVFERWILDVYLDLMNATAYDNREGESWNYDYTAYKPLTGLPIFPAFGVKGSF